jgi:DNA polymerase-3 subunit gamma/tau
MTYQVLARRWRPQSFDQMVGQEHVLRALVNALDGNRLHHAYLLTGTRGVGKTTLARLVAKCLNCERGVSASPCGECTACREIAEGRFVDLLEIDAASRTKVEDTRDLLDNVQYAPARGRFKVYLIDEVHMLSTHSFNALLKTLEEPPPHVKFLLATTDPQKLPATVLSRCLQLHLRNLAPEQIAAHLAVVLRADGIDSDEAALWEIALAAEGSMRDALSLTDQAIAHGGGSVRASTVTEMLGHVDREQLRGLMNALLAADAAAALTAVATLAGHGGDCERALGELLALLHRVALVQAVPGAAAGLHAERAHMEQWATAASAADVQLYYQVGVQARRDLPYAPDARSGLEMALLRMIAFRPAAAPPPGAPLRPATVQEAAGPAKKPEAAPVPAPRPEQAPARPEQVNAGNWAALLDVLEVGGVARSVAANALPEQADARTLCLVMDEGHATLHNPAAEERLAAALGRHFGVELALRIRHGVPGAETPAGRDARRAAERQRAAVEAIGADPNVRLLLEAFDGRLHAETISATADAERTAAREETTG